MSSGITLKLWPQDCVSRAEDKCCGPQAVTDARSVCHKLGIPYYLIDEAEAFQKQVIDYFAEEYKAGRTPNPCVMCNEKLKFGALLDRARQLGGEYIATGHFARVEKSADGRRMLLKKGRDPRKDQSYFLFSLRQNQLARSLFPLGEMTKQDTREVARECQLKTADKEESMEICFVPDKDYGKFLSAAKLVAEASRRHRQSAAARCSATTRASSFSPSASARAWAFPRPSRSTSSNWMPRATASSSATIRRWIATNSGSSDCNWIPFDEPPGGNGGHGQNPLQPSRARPPPSARRPDGGAKVKLHIPQRAITPGPGLRVLRGRLGRGRRLDHRAQVIRSVLGFPSICAMAACISCK